jgi:hypothetical protein
MPQPSFFLLFGCTSRCSLSHNFIIELKKEVPKNKGTKFIWIKIVKYLLKGYEGLKYYFVHLMEDLGWYPHRED